MPLLAAAQGSLFIAPPQGTYKMGDLFSVLVNVNSGGQAINAAAAQITFDNRRLAVTEMGYSRSVFSIWTEEPVFSNEAGRIRFSGGLPSPGFTGPSGAILRVTFKAVAPGEAVVDFVSGSVLANDGKGTNIADSLDGGRFTILLGAFCGLRNGKIVNEGKWRKRGQRCTGLLMRCGKTCRNKFFYWKKQNQNWNLQEKKKGLERASKRI